MARYIEHTDLRAFATRKDIEKLCEEAKRYGFYGVCVNPYRVRDAKELLKNENIKVISVVGFPFGATFCEVKIQEALMAIHDGADEIDMVMNIGAFKEGNYSEVEREIREVVEVAHPQGVNIKVIIGTCLKDEEKLKACELIKNAGADFVKTSIGKERDIKLIHQKFPELKIKAGGIKNASQAIEMIEAGASRIGTSRGVDIIESLR